MSPSYLPTTLLTLSRTRARASRKAGPVVSEGCLRAGLAAAAALALLPPAAPGRTTPPRDSPAPVIRGQATTQASEDAGVYAELPNLHRVSVRLYRGGQPRPGGLARLSALGVDTIVNLRGRGAAARAEEREARALGLRYYNVELPTWGRPEDSAVARVLDIIRDPGSGVVFVHCKDGVDRTGVVVACYRMAEEGWTAEAAAAEARARGMRPVQVWMRDYISEYPRRHASGLHAAPAEEDFDDRLGDGVRRGERGLRAAEAGLRKGVGATGRALRKTGSVFGGAFGTKN
jgi:protein tyrosine phosphatase (PTP) superfamily phosphohydrolase (DUF442 family)